MPISNFNINGWFKKDMKVNQASWIVIQINPNRPTNYTKMQAWVVVTHATSYDVLVEGVVSIPWGLALCCLLQVNNFLVQTFESKDDNHLHR